MVFLQKTTACKGTEFVVTLQTAMKRKSLADILLLSLLLVVVVPVTTGCHRFSFEVKRFQKDLTKQERVAEQLTDSLVQRLQCNSFDSIWELTRCNPSILFYVFDNRKMVYWSDKWLAGSEVRVLFYNRWYYQKFDNAHCICRWTKQDDFNVLTVIPVKYAYPVENKQLHNDYVFPFRLPSRYSVTQVKKTDSYPVYSASGYYLFSISQTGGNEVSPVKSSPSQLRLSDTFSYRSLSGSSEEDNLSTGTHKSVRVYLLLSILLFSIVGLAAVIGLIRNNGFKRMTLRTKMQYLVILLLLVDSLYIFLISTHHVRKHYEEQQIRLLQEKTLYIQKALQEIYYWSVSLGPVNESGMNINLRDLSFTYETDMHVYDMEGNLVGSSAINLFYNGLLSRHIDPLPFFTENSNIVKQEHIGDLNYLAAYTELYNGSYVQIGYIVVPLFISSETVDAEVDSFIAKLLPPVLSVILLSFLLSIVMTKGITRPLSSLADKMKHFKIGEHGNLLDYDKQDEVGQLVVRYNQMVTELEKSTEKLAKSERETAWRTMARQIAHEINNPLTPMKLTIQQLQRLHSKTFSNADLSPFVVGGQNEALEKYNNYFKKSTAVLIEQIDTLSRIASSFSSFAKMPEVQVVPVNIAQKLFSVITLFRSNNAAVPIRYVGAETGVWAMTDEQQISQVFNNLIKNALQAIEGVSQGDIIIILKQTKQDVVISVSDNGCGIAADVRDKVFRPNFTTKNNGMGLGLAISKNIIEGSGGDISFVTSKQGTTFYVHLLSSEPPASFSASPVNG